MEFDYVVIGAGSAGCAAAARLSESARCTVALLEAGGRDTNPLHCELYSSSKTLRLRSIKSLIDALFLSQKDEESPDISSGLYC